MDILTAVNYNDAMNYCMLINWAFFSYSYGEDQDCSDHKNSAWPFAMPCNK